MYSKMTLLAVFLFTIVFQISRIEASRYDIDDAAGIVSIVLLVLAVIVGIISMIMFFYIVYKLWNGDIGHRRYYKQSDVYHVSREKIVMDEHIDGGEDTKPIYTFQNQVAVTEEAREEAETTIVETTVVQEALKDEEVIVSQAPPTDEAEMETQELVVVFDDNDDVVDVLTHVT